MSASGGALAARTDERAKELELARLELQLLDDRLSSAR
jgi:hypothetical protein